MTKMEETKLWVLGLPVKDYTSEINKALEEADKIVAALHLKDKLVPWHRKFSHKNWFFFKHFSEALEEVEKALSSEKKVAFWASGDPLFFGVGKKFLTRFDPREIKLIPALSSLQVAFAEAKILWEGAFFVSLHGSRKTERNHTLEDIPALVRQYKKLVILTDSENSPKRIAHTLLEARLYQIKMIVAERLGRPEENIIDGTPADFSQKDFKTPNLVIIISEELNKNPVFGLKEKEFLYERGLITKDEVRAVILHKLRLPHRGIFWDIGAGSGSVSCEVANLSPGLLVYAVEKHRERINLIKKNRQKFGLFNVKVIEGNAPEVLSALPSPDRVFIGGGGKGLEDILNAVWLKLKSGPVVIATITIESLDTAYRFLKEKNGLKEVVSIQVSRSSHRISGYTYLKAQNQIYLLVGEKYGN